MSTLDNVTKMLKIKKYLGKSRKKGVFNFHIKERKKEAKKERKWFFA